MGPGTQQFKQNCSLKLCILENIPQYIFSEVKLLMNMSSNINLLFTHGVYCYSTAEVRISMETVHPRYGKRLIVQQ